MTARSKTAGRALAFPSDDALRAVLMGGMCPADVQAKGARVARDANGTLFLAPEAALSDKTVQALRAAGVTVDADLPGDAQPVGCWAEALGLIRAPLTHTPPLALLATSDRETLIDVAAELLRLGCERQELLVTTDGGLLRVVDPPTYTVVRAADRDRGLRGYVPDPHGQETVWTEIGFRHPLASRLTADKGHLLLVARDGWRMVRDDGWKSLESALELTVGSVPVERVAQPLKQRRKVELRFAPGRREAPSLWVIRRGGTAAVDRLLEYLPEEIVGRLTFAAAGRNATTLSVPGMRLDDLAEGAIILRARAGRHGPPDLSLPAEEYAPLAHMPDVYAPAGAIVEPPLRRERLRETLGVEQGHVSWLAPLDPSWAGSPGTPIRGPFRVERITDSAFVPLTEWADYVIHASMPALQPWQRAVVFDFAPFVSTGLEWASERPARAKREETVKPERTKPQRGGRAPVATPAGDSAPAKSESKKPQRQQASETAAPRAEIAVDQQLATLEAAFVALDAPADAPERLDLLEELGRIYARLNRRRDAGLCFSRAVWELTGAAATERLDGWLAAELGRSEPEAALRQLLAATAPSQDDVRRVATIAARGGASIKKDAHAITRWLDDHDGELDARTLWLARAALAKLAGGDTLALARTRDRILARLAGGLPAERELPSFLRFAGRSGALGAASGESLGVALGQLASDVTTVKRKRSPVEATVGLTNAYATLQLAHGFARIGQHARARTMINEARSALASVASDPVHNYLIAAFTARIEQAIAGDSPEAPLPDALRAQLESLDRVSRYKVDRLREASRILEPLERPDAIGAFSKKQQDSRGPEFAALRAITDPAARAKEVARLVELAKGSNEAEMFRLLDGVFDVLLELPESGAVPILGRAWPIIDKLPEARRALLYAEALVVAGHFGRTDLVPKLLDLLGNTIPAVPGNELARVLDQSLRALRRIGLRREIAELLAGVERALGGDNTNQLARLALAGGLAYLGDTMRALPILDQARRGLADASMRPVERLDLTRALAAAYAQAPIGDALAAIGELRKQLRDITDSFGTNSHYCLSVLHFVESLVLGIASDDLALGEAGRRFVEDDEHLIRRRLHRDLGGNA